MNHSLQYSLAALLLLASCRHTPSDATATSGSEPTEETQEVRVVRQHVNIPHDFSYITNLSSVDIVFTQGDFAVDAEGDSALLRFLDVNFDSNLMTVNIVTENNMDLNAYGNQSRVKLYVSCPELKCVSLCGNGGFECPGSLKSEHLQLGLLGSGNMTLNRVECESLNLQTTAPNSISIAALVAEKADLYSSNAATMDITMEVGELTLMNDASKSITLKGKANEVLVTKPNDPNLKNEVQMPPHR